MRSRGLKDAKDHLSGIRTASAMRCPCVNSFFACITRLRLPSKICQTDRRTLWYGLNYSQAMETKTVDCGVTVDCEEADQSEVQERRDLWRKVEGGR